MSTYRLHGPDGRVSTVLYLRTPAEQASLVYHSDPAATATRLLELGVEEGALTLQLTVGATLHSRIHLPMALDPGRGEGVRVELEEDRDPGRIVVGRSSEDRDEPPPQLYSTYIWSTDADTFSLAILLGPDRAILLPMNEGR